MSADLLAMLNAGMPGASMSNRNRTEEGKTILTFKAGKMKTELQPNGKYLVSPDPRRGTLSLVWTSNVSSSGNNTSGNNNSNTGGLLKLEWKDRRTRTVVDSLSIFPEDDCTYSRVETGRENDRVYLLQYGNASDRRFFFWLQEKEDKDDEDNCVKMNVLMSDAEECAKAAGEEGAASGGASGSGDASGSGGGASSTGGGDGGSGMDVSNLGGGTLDNQALMQIMQGLGSGAGGSSGSGGGAGAAAAGSNSGGSAGSGTPSAGQVDALSSILENLGMPQQNQQGGGSGDNAGAETPSATTSASTPAAPSRGAMEESKDDAAAATPAPSGGGMLTLADLQGAMAGLSTATPAAAVGTAGPPLSELATPESISESGILENEEVKAKLIALLPEGQRTEESLKDTLRSPQVVQCLKSLTSALVSDDGSLDGLNSVLANFDLKAEDGASAIASGNPIQAFLDCVLKSVEREKEAKDKESDGNEESKKEGGED